MASVAGAATARGAVAAVAAATAALSAASRAAHGEGRGATSSDRRRPPAFAGFGVADSVVPRCGRAARSQAFLRCESTLGTSLPAPQVQLVERLQRDTCALLADRIGAAAEAGACPLEEVFVRLGAPELAELFRRVEAVMALTEAIDRAGLARRPDGGSAAAARAEYQRLLRAIAVVERATLGPEARPLAETRWWTPLVQRWRYYVCSIYSWGLFPEEVVSEAAEVLRQHGCLGVVDPLAGSGWHARLWQDCGGLAVVALDSYALRPVAWSQVKVVPDARDCPDFGIGSGCAPPLERWALHLSWPPHAPETVGVDLLRKWPGKMMVYLGERATEDAWVPSDMGVTGGQELLDEIARAWEPVRTWEIPRWPGYRDDVTVYRRKEVPCK